jgi:isoquinoline 1-oxidoreductase beta subunit
VSQTRRIARRAFLIGSVAVAGGVGFGVYLVRRPLGNPLLDDLGQGEAALTAFVKIDIDGIVLITPRADVGQGIHSTQAHLIAEELDVDPHQVRLSPGEPHPAYFNGVVLSESAPFAGHDERWIAERMREALRTPAKLLGMQITGGSTSVPDMFDRLRTAGAVARETLKLAAALRYDVPTSALATRDGAVILPDGTSISYTALAPAAGALQPVADVVLRPPADWRFIGKPMRRTDMLAKSTGTARYGIDFALEEMLHATVRTNPGIGGEVKQIDATRAREMRGVHRVVPIRHGVGVIADNTWRAFRAAEAVDIEWGPGPYPASSEEMWKVLESSVTRRARDSQLRNDGNVEAALAEADVIEAEYRTPFLAHAPLEPMNAVVRVTDERADIWTGTQIPGFLHDHAAEITGLAPEDVHVHALPSGGSFGARLDDTYALQAVELAMTVKGTPVKMTRRREEDMSHDYPRPAQYALARGAVRDGRVEVLDLHCVGQSVTASWFGRLASAPPGPDTLIVAGAWDQPFAIPHYRVTGYAPPQMVPVGSWRAPGACSNGFIHDSFLDELIHAAGADPLAERIRLCHHDVSRRVLEAVGEMSDWNGSTPDLQRGRGVAFTYSHGVPVAQVVEVTNTDDGIRIDRVFVAADVGLIVDPINFEAQLSGSVVWGLGHAMNCQLTYRDYAPEQRNFDQHFGMRLHQTPHIEVLGLENGSKIRGIGEPGVPPAAAALANAIFAATGQRIRELPLDQHITFA